MSVTANYPIESGIPVPKVRTNKANLGRLPPNAKYPWRHLALGESFFVPRVKLSNFNGTIARANLNYHPAKFMARTVVNSPSDWGTRIWRTA